MIMMSLLLRFFVESRFVAHAPQKSARGTAKIKVSYIHGQSKVSQGENGDYGRPAYGSGRVVQESTEHVEQQRHHNRHTMNRNFQTQAGQMQTQLTRQAPYRDPCRQPRSPQASGRRCTQRPRPTAARIWLRCMQSYRGPRVPISRSV